MTKKTNPLKCLLAKGRRNRKGCLITATTWTRPRVRVNGKQILATRHLFRLELGRSLGRWELVCHHCDDLRCLERSHLYLGSAKTNALDAGKRRRMWVQQRRNLKRVSAINKKNARGSDRKRMMDHQKINPDWFPKLIQRYKNGESLASIARDYSVHRTTIKNWISGALLRSRKAIAEWEFASGRK